jgi:hypothetical protein
VILPTVMVKNEARFIQAVLRPLVTVFGTAIVGDTGSTDGTLEIAQASGAVVLDLGPQDAWGLTTVRRQLGLEARARGAQWQLLCDGDELYSVITAETVRDTPIPPAGRCGFTGMLSIDEDPDGSLWEMADTFSRCAVMPCDVKWGGEHPFESPACYRDPESYFYYAAPPGLRYHAVHLHRLRRSQQDEVVLLRQSKQKQFSMQDLTISRTLPFDMADWLRC